MRITAPVLVKARQPMQMLELDLDDPRSGEVRVKMTASGVCHSCLLTADGTHYGAPTPIVLGDEGSGIVDAVGPGCRTLSPGDHVVLSWAPSCLTCRPCHRGYPALCLNKAQFGRMADGTTRFRYRGTDVYHYGPATYGSYTVVPEDAAVRIRKDFPLDLAALIGCSVTTGFGAVVNTARVRAGQGVAILGCGGIGLNAVQAAALAGADPIIGVDVIDSKLDFAREFGATHTVNSAKEDLVDRVMGLTGHGVDACIVAVGRTAAMEQGLSILAPRGVEVVIGLTGVDETFGVNPMQLIQGEHRILGSNYGSSNPAVEFPRMVELAMAGRLRIGDLITRRYDLDQADEAFRALAAGEQARGLIVF